MTVMRSEGGASATMEDLVRDHTHQGLRTWDSIASNPQCVFSFGLVTGYLYSLLFHSYHCSARLISGFGNGTDKREVMWLISSSTLSLTAVWPSILPGVMFDKKSSFEWHIHSVLSSFTLKIGLLRKSNRIIGHQCLTEMFYFFCPSLLGVLYCHLVWSSATDSHLNENLQACKFIFPNLTISLQHYHSISSLYMLYKTFQNPMCLLHSELLNLF